TRMVMLGTGLLGAASGVIGVFLLLRKRALLGDAISHATLPGVCIAFLIGVASGGSGKSMPLLLSGAATTGLLGGLAILGLRQFRRIKEDAALGIVLSIFFGLGILLLTLIQQIPEGHAAGLEGFIYGKTASMVAEDAVLIASVTGCVLLVALLLYRPMQLLCFDEGYAASQGWPVFWLDGLLMSLVVAITIVGLQAVGLIMIIALLVVPAAASRFWTHQLPKMLPLSAALATFSCLVGATISALA
ncbi:MAG: metal ABC transporter permease, partial [Planctomyces sp.]|nr:metal ABC transporter permease [Planctomyces sp.]